jgi:hypothetical protein
VIGSAGRLAGGALHDPEVEAFLRLDGEPPVAQVDDPSAAEVLSADRDHRHLKQPLQQPHRRGRADDAATAAPWSRNAPGWFSGWRRCSRTPGSADQRRLALLTKSGRAILEALLTGQDDPDALAALAALARGRLCVKISALRQALAGRFRVAHHGLLVAQMLAHVDFLDAAIAELDTTPERAAAPFQAVLKRVCTIPRVSAPAIMGWPNTART